MLAGIRRVVGACNLVGNWTGENKSTAETPGFERQMRRSKYMEAHINGIICFKRQITMSTTPWHSSWTTFVGETFPEPKQKCES